MVPTVAGEVATTTTKIQKTFTGKLPRTTKFTGKAAAAAAAAAPAAATRHTATTKSDAAVNIKETTAKLIEAGVIFNGTKPAM